MTNDRQVIAAHREVAPQRTQAAPEVELLLLERVTSLQELTAEELIARGERLVKLGTQLQALSMGIMPAEVAHIEDRSVGKLGAVNEVVAIQTAKALGEFDRLQFAEAVGLRASGTSRWLAKLMEHEPPIIERTEAGAYRYIPPPSNGSAHRRLPAPETELIDQAPARGEAIPVEPVQRAQRGDRANLSRPKTGHAIRQRQKRYEANQNGKKPGRNGRP